MLDFFQSLEATSDKLVGFVLLTLTPPVTQTRVEDPVQTAGPTVAVKISFVLGSIVPSGVPTGIPLVRLPETPKLVSPSDFTVAMPLT